MKDFQAVQTAPSVRGHRALVLNCCTVATLLLSAAAPGVDDSLAAAAHRPPAPRRRALSPAERAAVTDASFGASAREFAALGSEPYARDRDLVFVDAPGAWHQQVARIVDHRFSTFDELFRFALDAKKAGVGALMLVQIQKTEACPGAWYNGLQLCDHINGSYPVPDGSLSQWRRMLSEIAPMRLMWWNNPTYWSIQGQVWTEAKSDKDSDVGRWFSWGPEDCEGIPACAYSAGAGTNIVVPHVGCAQGSWQSDGENPTTGKQVGIPSALASFGSKAYADYLVEAMSNTWTRNLGIDGYTEDCSSNYPCMLQLSDPSKGSLPDWASIVGRVRKQQPQLVMSGEGYESWEEMIIADANLGGQGQGSYHTAMQAAVTNGDASQLEGIASTSGSDAATVLCYLHPHYDGKQPGACPTMYFRDGTSTLKDVKQHNLWVALEAGSGIVPQHDYDPDSSCAGWIGCGAGSKGAWWNVTQDPFVEGEQSPLLAFEKYRALNRLALRTKLNITSAVVAAGPMDAAAGDSDEGDSGSSGSGSMHRRLQKSCKTSGPAECGPNPASCLKCNTTKGAPIYDCLKCCPNCKLKSVPPYTFCDCSAPPAPPVPNTAKGALAYLKHDALGPSGEACIMVFNPGPAQSVTIDLSPLLGATTAHEGRGSGRFARVLGGEEGGEAVAAPTVPFDMFDPKNATGPPLAKEWTVEMGAGSVKAFGGFDLGAFAPRVGKKSTCVADDGYERIGTSTTLQSCFLECLGDSRCSNLVVDYVEVFWMEKPKPVRCTLLGPIANPAAGCKPGNNTLIKKLVDGRPAAQASL